MTTRPAVFMFCFYDFRQKGISIEHISCLKSARNRNATPPQVVADPLSRQLSAAPAPPEWTAQGEEPNQALRTLTCTLSNPAPEKVSYSVRGLTATAKHAPAPQLRSASSSAPDRSF